MIAWFTAYLILPDGSHALASCGQTMAGPPCLIEAFVAEKRVKVPCDLIKVDTKGLTRECYPLESYWAERKGNDITLKHDKWKGHVPHKWIVVRFVAGQSWQSGDLR